LRREDALITRPMRQGKREVTDRAEVDAIILKASICRLGMVDGGRPYIVPMNFGYDGVNLYFHCAREGRKIDVLRRSPEVCFELEVDHGLVTGDLACQYTNDFESVMGEGVAELLEDSLSKSAALDLIMSHYAKGPFHYDAKNLDLTLIIRVRISGLKAKRHLKRP
jgi:nitroimidazol reductase NimA-like FMN-containing flavoprotein (pyridoxamine 5'-phosphate oxidase superfamily)